MESIESIILAVFGLVSVVESTIDGVRTKMGKEVEHAISVLFRVACASLTPVILYVDVRYMFTFGTLMLLVYWIPFDICFNIGAGRPVSQMGKTAFTDRMANKYIGKIAPPDDVMYVYTWIKLMGLFAIGFIHTEMEAVTEFLINLYNYVSTII